MLLLYTYDKSRTWAKHLLYNIRETLARLGLTEASNGIYDKWIYLIIVIVASLTIMFLLRIMMRYILQRITQYRKAAFIQELIDTNLIAHALWLIPFTGVQLMLPYAFGTSSIFAVYFQRICSIFIVCIIVSIINTGVTILWNTFYEHSRMHNRPMKGLLQIIHATFIALGCIISISILINRSPTVLITGLGAFAAVLMLIFKDSILGFVAGIQLTQYDMVRNDDWITIPGTIVDGVITDVSLNTVKVRNYDNTTIMLPPYTLISQPIQNWRGMKESGGRRIMKARVIDLNSIQFCTAEFINKISSHTIVKTFIEQNNIQPYTPSYTRATEVLNADNIVETNLGLLRLYITQYLMQHPDIQHQGYTLMVRSLEPDANGIPLQIYCFTTTTHWESYEKIQSQIIEYLTAIIPMFDLYPFQNASGRDYIIQSLIAQGYKPGDDLGINL